MILRRLSQNLKEQNWTAICIDRHYSDNTVVEIQMTAYAPKAP